MTANSYSSAPDGLRLAVRVTPRARRSQINGIVVGSDERSALAIKLTAPPVDGNANKALVAFLAKCLGLSASAITIRSGETARLKILHIAGDARDIADRLDTLLATSGAKGLD